MLMPSTQRKAEGHPPPFAFHAAFELPGFLELAALHEVEELLVGLRGGEVLDEELGCLNLVHVVDELPEDPDLLQLGRGLQELVISAMRLERWSSMLPVPLNSS